MEAKIDREFIVTLKNVNNTLQTIDVPIASPVELIAQMEAMVEDPCLNVHDMANLFTSHYPADNQRPIEYIAPKTYDEHGGNDSKKNFSVTYPTCPTLQELQKLWEQEAVKGENWCRNKCMSSKIIPTQAYINNCRKKFVRELKHKQKKDYLTNSLRWIDAFCYTETCKKLKADSAIKCFSKEGIGFHTYTHRISNDVQITLRTNFGYSNASYFLLAMRYKGIDILPYSYLVNYYHARMVDILRCTRVYGLQRESWIEAFDFISSKTAEANENPEKFIETYVIDEVRNMMNGLAAIASDPRAYMENIAENELGRQKSVRCRNISEKLDMEVYDNEMSLVFKIEKISGGYELTDSLMKLVSVCPRIAPELTNTINTLKEMYSALLPDIEEGKRQVRNRILDVNSKVWAETQESETVRHELSQYYERIDHLKEENGNFDMSSFESNNPHYTELKKRRKN